MSIAKGHSFQMQFSKQKLLIATVHTKVANVQSAYEICQVAKVHPNIVNYNSAYK